MANEIAEDENLPKLLDEYLTALVNWLRKISFLCKYRMVSMKEINLNYCLGTSKNFVHLYGELHGLYNEGGFGDEDYNAKSIEDSFTYNKSILLFRGSDVSSGMDKIREPHSYLSLSPFVIDQSEFSEKLAQTPEPPHRVSHPAHDQRKRQYNYVQYKKELTFGDKGEIVSNKSLKVMAQNTDQHRFNELFEQLEDIFKPLKIKEA